MKIYTVGRDRFRLPDSLNEFQLRLYIHLIKWKWDHLTRKPGFFRGLPYDAIIASEYADQQPTLHSSVRDLFNQHQERHPFKTHGFFDHVASSQAACANLFLPLLRNPAIADHVLSRLLPDYRCLATEYFDGGYRLEFWDEPRNCLNDHNASTGTDADIAIFYYDVHRSLNVWLVEHKLTEIGFSKCGGKVSRGRTHLHKCTSLGAILKDHAKCYYHSAKRYNYWPITIRHTKEFSLSQLEASSPCPFHDGRNQNWRNLLLALELERLGFLGMPVARAHFSVVHHPGNDAIQREVSSFLPLLTDTTRVTALPSSRILDLAMKVNDRDVKLWARWYREHYLV